MDHDPLTDADRAVSPDQSTDHDLVAVTTWLPGAEPTPYDIALSAGEGYRTRYWRCRTCGQERSRRREFGTACPAAAGTELAVDGGYAVADERTRRALAEELAVQFLDFGPGYAVLDDGTRYIVDIEAETCNCGVDDTTELCAHVRRADLAVRTGELPGPDGRYVR